MKRKSYLSSSRSPLASPRADKPKPDAKKELDKPVSTWVTAELEVNGVAVPGEEAQESTLVIEGAKYSVKVKDTTHETTIKIDPTKDPTAIDMLFPEPQFVA
jgi:uncharacterized protein (TIGR03067 family)